MSQNARPDYIIQEIGPWAFFDYVMPKYSMDMCPYIDRENFSFLKEITPELSYADDFRLVRYAGKLNRVINEFNNIDEHCDTILSDKTFHPTGLINGKQKFEHTPENISQFKQFIEECSANNIRLILVCSPILKEVSSTYFEMDRFWNLIDSINHDSRLTVLNYQDLFGNDTTMFMDYIHLNVRGTEEFSAKVGHDLKQILKQNATN